MKFTANVYSKLVDNKNLTHLSLLTTNSYHTRLLEELDYNKEYYVELREVKSKRSLQQNKFLWALLQQLEKVSKEDMMDWYCHALQDTNNNSIVILAPDNSEAKLLPAFRAVKKIGKRMVHDEKTNKETEAYMYRCFEGSSKMNVSEMNELLDTVIRYCHNWDIDVEEYRDGI